jgi:YbbR domain-containing protein
LGRDFLTPAVLNGAGLCPGTIPCLFGWAMSKFGSFFRENWAIKVAALALSVLVLFHVKTEGDGEVMFDVPVELEGIPDSLTWTGEAPRSVSVTFTGKLKNLIKLRLGSLRIHVDLAQAGPGRFQRTLSVGDVPVPEGSDVAVSEFAGPDRIDIVIERKISRTVPVAPLLEGGLSQGLLVDMDLRVNPPEVGVTGPASVVSTLDSIYTAPIVLSGRRGTVSVRAGLDKSGKALHFDRDFVEVVVNTIADSLGAAEAD